MVVVGVTLIELLVCPPGDHKNVPPALLGVAVRVAVWPEQMVVLLTATVGGAAIETVT